MCRLYAVSENHSIDTGCYLSFLVLRETWYESARSRILFASVTGRIAND